MGVQGHQRSKVHPQVTKQTKLARVVLPALEKIVKGASSRRHAKLVEECRTVIDWFEGGIPKAKQLAVVPFEVPARNLRALPPSPAASSEGTGAPIFPERSLRALDAESSTSSVYRGDGDSGQTGNSSALQGLYLNKANANSRSEGPAIEAESQFLHDGTSSELDVRKNLEEEEAVQIWRSDVVGDSSHRGSILWRDFDEQKADSGAAQSVDVSSNSSAATLASSADFLAGLSDKPAYRPLSTAASSSRGVLYDEGGKRYSLAETVMILRPLHSACNSGCTQLAEPALECFNKLLRNRHLHGEVSGGEGSREGRILVKVIESVCHCVSLAEDNAPLEISILRVLLSATCCSVLVLRGDVLLKVFLTCFRVATRSRTPLHQLYAKASLAQMLATVLARVDAGSMRAAFHSIVVADLVTLVDRPASEWELVQSFVSQVVEEERRVAVLESSTEDSLSVSLRPILPMRPLKMENTSANFSASQEPSVEQVTGVFQETQDMKFMSRKVGDVGMLHSSISSVNFFSPEHDCAGSTVGIANDVYNLLEELCKICMKSPGRNGEIEVVGLREKTLALELMCFVLETADSSLVRSQRFLALLRETLLLSLVENSASPLMTVFQLSCSVFLRLLSRLRSSLKFEIGEFFSILVLRPLEHMKETNPQQKFILLRLIESMGIDPQIWVDLYVNYDCDVDSSSIFEGLVNALLRLATSPLSVGGSTVLNQEIILRVAAMRCLGSMLRGLSHWTARQMHIVEGGGPSSPRASEAGSDAGSEGGGGFERGGQTEGESSEVLESSMGFSGDAATFKQRKLYKRELQEGIALFNKNPRKGILALVEGRKMGPMPENIAEFLKTQPGLDKTMIGDYLGDSDPSSAAVLQAYVDSFDLQGFEIDEGIRQLLKDFRLPGEAQKIERIMERFAERYFDCNPLVLSSAVTAHVLSYSVIMLNTDAHNPNVKTKMTKSEFICNNRGIDQGRDLPYDLLASLYERIVRNEIKMREDPFMMSRGTTPVSSRLVRSTSGKLLRENSRVARRSKEVRRVQNAADVVRIMQERFQARSSHNNETPYYTLTDYEIVRAMLSSTWGMFMTALGSTWENGLVDIMRVYVLEGYKEALRLCLLLGMLPERDVVFTSLNRFTMTTSSAHGRTSAISKVKRGKGRNSLFLCASGANSLDYQALTPKSPSPIFDCCYTTTCHLWPN